MPAVQDSLLTQASDNRQKAQSPRAEKQPQARERTDFHDVYARERASSVSEAKPAVKRAENTEKPAATPVSDANEPSHSDELDAETGKDLPQADEPPPQTDSQTLQWLGLDDEAQSALSVAPDPALSGLIPNPMALMPVSEEPLRISLGLSLEKGAVGQVDLTTQAGLGDGELVLDEELPLALDETLEVETKQSFERLFALKPLAEEVSSALTRSAASAEINGAGESRADNMLNRLVALAPAVSGQAVAGKGLPLVPGQAVPMHQAGWSDAVVDKVMWLSTQNLKSAEIQLDPAELGRLEVRISLNQESTQITFSSLNANVRDALESQMHRLRDLFAQQGMNQLDVNVSDQSLQREQQSGRGSGSAKDSSADDGLAGDAGGEVAAGLLPLREGLGVVDFYA